MLFRSHGGPPLGEPKESRADEDIRRWAKFVHLGHAWAASVFHVGGFAVRSATEDTERVRRIFAAHVATPRRTLLHGQSWGGLVAAKAADLYPQSWDGLLLTSSAIGGPLAYDFRLDLRVIYQYLCNNHPRPDEPAYPLSSGLPADSTLTMDELAARANVTTYVLHVDDAFTESMSIARSPSHRAADQSVNMMADSDAYATGLEHLAGETGGVYLPIQIGRTHV